MEERTEEQCQEVQIGDLDCRIWSFVPVNDRSHDVPLSRRPVDTRVAQSSLAVVLATHMEVATDILVVVAAVVVVDNQALVVEDNQVAMREEVQRLLPRGAKLTACCVVGVMWL